MAEIIFPEGLIGLEGYQRFVIQPIPGQDLFLLLQSLDDQHFSLVITSPFWFKPDYEFELPDYYTDDWGKQQNMAVFVVVTLAPQPQDITVNLLGPIIINMATNQGVQIVAPDRGYTTQYRPLKPEMAGE